MIHIFHDVRHRHGITERTAGEGGQFLRAVRSALSSTEVSAKPGISKIFSVAGIMSVGGVTLCGMVRELPSTLRYLAQRSLVLSPARRPSGRDSRRT